MSQVRDADAPVAVVTGASSGIGAATALELGRQGWRVAVGARRVERIEEVAKQIEKEGGVALAHVLDLDPDGLLERCESERITMCGVRPTAAVIHAAKALGATGVELVRYGNSGEASGDYERGMGVDGVRYTHVLDPRTGWPVAGLASVSVVAPHCLVAGSASTIAMLRGADGPAPRGARPVELRHEIEEHQGLDTPTVRQQQPRQEAADVGQVRIEGLGLTAVITVQDLLSRQYGRVGVAVFCQDQVYRADPSVPAGGNGLRFLVSASADDNGNDGQAEVASRQHHGSVPFTPM